MKLNNQRISRQYLERRVAAYEAKGYEQPKWISFCYFFLAAGFDVFVYEARQTVSKYITVKKGLKQYKVRFSNHKPIYHREVAQDCDFFVGKTNLGVTNTSNAIKATLQHFNT